MRCFARSIASNPIRHTSFVTVRGSPRYSQVITLTLCIGFQGSNKSMDTFRADVAKLISQADNKTTEKVLVTEAQHTLTATITVNESKTKAIIDSLKKLGCSVTDKVTKQAFIKIIPLKQIIKNYTVKNGDSFWSIAQSQLKKWHKIQRPCKL